MVTNPGPNPTFDDFSNHVVLGQLFEMASFALNNWKSIPDGLFHKVIRDRFTNRKLFSALNVDVYIDDGRNEGYDYNEWFWNCQDIVVRRNSADAPTMGHEEPVVNQPNYAWMKVKRKGSGNPGGVIVKAFSCSPGTGLIWPLHWIAMAPASLPTTSLNSATEEWVGPFAFNQTQIGHECLLAIVEADNDRANTQIVTGNVQHWMLVPFDNNIGQRNISPVAAEKGKKIREFRIINSTDAFSSILLNVEHDLPKSWKLEFDIQDIKNIQLSSHEEKWVKLSVTIPREDEFHNVTQKAKISITSLVNGLPDGCMTFEFVHPSKISPYYKKTIKN